MGIIQRQSIKQSFLHFVGIAIGAISVIFIYPRDETIYGFIRFMLDASVLLSSMIFVGTQATAIKFFPFFQDKKNGHNGFLTLLLKYALLSHLIFGVLKFCFI